MSFMISRVALIVISTSESVVIMTDQFAYDLSFIFQLWFLYQRKLRLLQNMLLNDSNNVFVDVFSNLTEQKSGIQKLPWTVWNNKEQ